MGTLRIRNSPPPQDHHRALGIALLLGPRSALVLMSEVPMYRVGAYPLEAAAYWWGPRGPYGRVLGGSVFL